MLDGLAKNRIDAKKPRREGLTCTIDRLQGMDRENFAMLAPFVDVVKIYGALPLLASEEGLKKR